MQNILNKKKGYIGEQAVSNYLINKGYTIVKTNYCIRGGEIDIIAIKDEILAFVEVKLRKTDGMVSGVEAVSKKKQALIIKTAYNFIFNNNFDLQPRFDVAEVNTCNEKIIGINYITNAFDASGVNI